MSDTIWGILSVALALYGVYVTYKLKTRPKLIFYSSGSVPLFEQVSKNIDNLEIKYKNNPITTNLYLFKGTLVNSGNIDIDKAIIHEPLEIALPEGYKWAEFKIINKSNDLKIDFINNDNFIRVDWGLFKKEEFFSFNSVIIIPETKDPIRDLSRIIKFNFRINNLYKIQRGNFDIENRKRNYTFLFPLIFFVLFGLICFLPNQQIKYHLNGTDKEVELKAKNNLIEIKNKKENIYILEDPKKIIEKGEINLFLTDNKKQRYHTGIIMILIGIILSIPLYINERKERKRYSLMRINK